MPAGDEHLVVLAGVEVGAAQLHRPDARAVLDGQVPDHFPGQRHGHPFRPGHPAGGCSRSLVTSVQVIAGPGVSPAAQAALGPQHGAAVIEQDEPGGADGAGFVGPPRRPAASCRLLPVQLPR